MLFGKTTKSAFLLLSILVVLIVPWLDLQCHAPAKSPEYKELRLFRQVMGIVQKNYVKEVTDKELIQGAITGMLQSLDPHSSYLTEDLFKELQVETKGEFGGLGIEITLENGILTIVSPIEDTPAYKAGLKPGDKILVVSFGSGSAARTEADFIKRQLETDFATATPEALDRVHARRRPA